MKKWGYLLALLILLQTLSLSLYLGKTDQFGFPIDDAWIHQTYARNLGLHGVMAFSPGQPSTGSTSFGWTLLLSAGYWLNIPPFLWTYFLGAIFTLATAFTAGHLSQAYFGSFKNAVIVAVICILEWHLAWATVSGMEISLFTFLMLLFFLFFNRDSSAFLLGGLAGAIVLVRPEGIILAVAYGFRLILTKPYNPKRILWDAANFLLVFSVVISPWILFNLIYGDRPFPSTITAKFVQYGYPISLGKSLKYLWDVLIYFLNGPIMLLVPGTWFTVYQALKTRSMPHFYPFAWSFTLIGLYAVALPVIYDQGRYLMPFIPLITIYGIEGLAQILKRLQHTPRLHATIWLSLACMVFLLWLNGASDYAYRTQLYRTVHMQAAEWINLHAPPDAVIATHDIGIIGYYTGRQIVDLAGLVTPEIIPMIKNQQEMAKFINAKHVTYLIVYSGYYRELITALDAHLVFSPGGEQLRTMGVEPFEIYEITR